MDKFIVKNLKRTNPPPVTSDSDLQQASTSSPSSAMEPPRKKAKAVTKFRPNYEKEWSFIKPSTKGETYARCVPCGVDFSVASGGRDDIQKHIRTNKHASSVKEGETSVNIGSFFVEKRDLSVIKSEVLFTKFLVDNNLPIAVSDKFGDFLRAVCPDSDIAKNFACARTKTSAIISCIGRNATEELVEKMKSNTFSLGTDGSNDHHSKLYPIVVFLNDEASEKVTTELLSVAELPQEKSSSAVNITELIVTELAKHKVPLSNCLSFMSDNANVMVGKKGGVSTLLKKEQPNMLSLGCGCHLLNLAVKKSVTVLPVKVDEFLTDIFYFFHHSEKKLAEFNEFQKLYNSEARQILKYCPTRWLCLTTSLQRVMELWKPLVKYFNKVKEEAEQDQAKKAKKVEVKDGADTIIDSWFQNPGGSSTNAKPSSERCSSKPESFSSGRLERIHSTLNSKQAVVYCGFLLWIMPTFDKYNKLLQSEEPQIHKLKDLYFSLFKDLLMKFIKPDIISLNCNDLTKVKFADSKTHKSELYIGELAQDLMGKLKAKHRHDISTTIKSFYITALEYMTHNFPLQDAILHHAQLANINKRHTMTFESVQFFASKLPHLSVSKDKLHEEFSNFQCTDLPEAIMSETRADRQWNMLMQQVNIFDSSTKPFHHLAKVVLSILSIPHSNASAERVFSLVRKNRNEVRATMSTKTLNALLVTKVRPSRPLNMTDQFLRRCKTATMDSLQSSSSH